MLYAETGLEVSGFRIVGGVRNALDAAVSESPLLPIESPGPTTTPTYPSCVPRNACQTGREFYFSMSLILLD